MPAKSNHYGDVYQWVISVINSCENWKQMMSARKLIYHFEKMYYNDNYEHNMVIWRLVSEIRLVWAIKSKLIIKMKPEFITVNEQNRTYYFPNGEKVEIKEIESINISKSGTHRLNTKDGKKHIVPSGWIHIEFDAKDWTF